MLFGGCVDCGGGGVNVLRKAAIALHVLATCTVLAACAHTSEPVIRTVEVKVPVAVRCGSDPGPTPAFSDTNEALRAAKDIFERVRLVMAGRSQRDGWIATLTASSAGCR